MVCWGHVHITTKADDAYLRSTPLCVATPVFWAVAPIWSVTVFLTPLARFDYSDCGVSTTYRYMYHWYGM